MIGLVKVYMCAANLADVCRGREPRARLELLGQLPLDRAPLAPDAVNSIQAQNSLEKMLMHQEVTAHEMAVPFSTQALSCRVENSLDVARYAASATRCMTAYQSPMIALQRMRGGE